MATTVNNAFDEFMKDTMSISALLRERLNVVNSMTLI